MEWNIIVDAVVLAVLEEVCGPHEAHYWLVWVAGESNLTFYADDRWIVGRDPDWLQESLVMTVDMFGRVELETNLEKTKAIFCTPGFI